MLEGRLNLLEIVIQYLNHLTKEGADDWLMQFASECDVDTVLLPHIVACWGAGIKHIGDFEEASVYAVILGR